MFQKTMGFVLLLLGLMMGSVCHAELYENPTVAVMPFQNKVPDSWEGFGDHADLATEELVALLMDRPDVFQVIERIELQDLVDEQSLGMTGLIAADSAVETGNISGVEYKIFGALTHLSANQDSLGLGDLIGSQASVVAHVTIRVVDVRTGRVVLIGQGKGSSKRISASVLLDTGEAVTIGSSNVRDEQAFNAVRKAIKDAVNGKEGIFTKMGVNEKRKKK